MEMIATLKGNYKDWYSLGGRTYIRDVGLIDMILKSNY
jgi:hypothetical protein